MVGLPGSGKTTWAHKYAKEEVQKKFNVLGFGNIYANMKVRPMESTSFCCNGSSFRRL